MTTVHNQIRGHIAACAYFAGIDESELTFIADHSLLRTYAQGAILFLEGDVADGLWIVEQGHIKIYKLNPDGGEHILHLRGPGATFNDIAALDGSRNPASAAALSPQATVWLVSVAVIQQVLARNSTVARNVIGLLAERVRTLVGQIEDLALYSVTVRLARLLLRQAADPSLHGPGVTRAALAAHINTTPQTVSQLLRALEDAGAITFDRRRIVIRDAARLRAIALASDAPPQPLPAPATPN